MAKLSSLVDKAQKKQREQANAASSKVVDTNLSKLNAVENMQNRGSASAWFTKVEAPKLTPNEYDSEVSRLQQIRQQAAVDLNTDVVNDIDKRLKALREQQGLTTFGDRANDVTTAISAGVFGSAASTLGLGVNMFNDPERYQREINRLQTALDTGKTTDGMVLNEAQRKTVQDSIADLQRKKKQAESKDSLHNKIYSVADRATEDSATAHLRAKQDLGKVGSTIVDAGVAFGQSAVAGVLGGVTGTGLAPFMVQAFGSAAQDARKNGGDLSDQLLLGSTQAAKEYITEKLFGIAVPQKLAGTTGSFDNWIKKRIQNVAGRLEKPGAEMALGGLLTWLAGGATEALEEGIGALIEETIINPNFKGYTTDDRTTQEKFEEALYNALIGGVSGLMGVTNLLDYTPGTVSTSTGKPQIVNATRSVEQATVFPAASPEVQQVRAQAEVTKAQNPEAEVLDAATTLFTQQGMNLKTAQTRAEIVGKLVRGEEVSGKDLNKIDPTSNQTKQIFTQLTGVQFPEGKIQIEALRNLYRSAHTVAQAARVTMKEQAIQEIQQMSAEQIVERAKQARQATTPESDKKAAQILAQARGEIAPDGTALLSYKDFAARFKQAVPDATTQKTARMYDLYLRDNQTISFMGRRMTRQQVLDTLNSAPDSDKMTPEERAAVEARLNELFDAELEQQRQDGKDATEHSVRNKEANNGRREDSVHSERLSGQPDQRSGGQSRGVSEETGRAEGDEGARRGDQGGSQASRRGQERASGQNQKPQNHLRATKVKGFPMTEVLPSGYTSEMQAVVDSYEGTGANVHIVVEGYPVDNEGHYADGITIRRADGRIEVYLQVVSNKPLTQRSDHELAHVIMMADPRVKEEAILALADAMTEDELSDLVNMYLPMYGSAYANSNDLLGDLLEEIVGDAYSNLDRADAGAPKYHDAVFGVLEAQRQTYSASYGQELTLTDDAGNLVVETDDQGHSRFSMSTYDESGRDILTQWMGRAVVNGDLTSQDADDIIKTMDLIYDICKEARESGEYAPFDAWSEAKVVVNEKGEPVFSVVKANGDYAMNLDFSLVCKKRRTLDAVLNELVKRGFVDNLALNERQIVKINDLIRSYGFEVACDLCFVDAKRYRQGKVADDFVKLYNGLVKSMLPKGSDLNAHYFNFGGSTLVENTGNGVHELPDNQLDFTRIDKILETQKPEKGNGSVEYRIAKHLKENPADRKLTTRGDFLSTRGFDTINRENPGVLKLFNAKKGSGGPKSAVSDVQYLNEVLTSKTFTPEKAYAVGGVRIQSFSDYVPRMIFDYVQMIADLAAKKLPAHAYTKEELFVKQFGLTGMKINMSLIPKVVDGGIAPGLDADGNYAWADESFDFNEAKRIQKAEGYSRNCGTIAVGVSDAHIRKLMADPEIRMVIPYHKSGLNPVVAKMNKIDAFVNYTDFQNTRRPNGKNGKKLDKDVAADKKLLNEMPDFNQTMRELGDPRAAAEKYVRWCEENNLLPKFNQFAYKQIDGVVVEKDGKKVVDENYYKLLEDFTVYDKGEYVGQTELKMTFPTEDSAFGSMRDLIRRGLKEDAILEGNRTEKVPEIANEIMKFSVASEKSGAFNLDDYDIEDLLKLSDAEFQKLYDELGLDRNFEIDDDILLEDDFGIEDVAEDLDVEPEKIEILYRRAGLGGTHVAEDKQAVMTEERIDARIKEHGATRPDYARRYITRIAPKDFIDMTVYERNVDRQNFDTRVGGDFGTKMGEWDFESALRDSEEPPVLIIDKSTGQIIGHNGRHRIRALEMSGIESVEIEVQLHDEDGYMIKYGAETIPDMAISSQFDTKIETHLSNIIPLNKSHRDEIMQSYGEKAHTGAKVKYSVIDADYMAAVERGDMETAQKMVDQAAKAAGYTVKAYHGTKSDFTSFDAKRTGDNYGGWSATGTAFDFALREDHARMWGAKARGLNRVRVIPAYLRTGKTFYTYSGEVSKELEAELPDNLTPDEKASLMSVGASFKGYLEEELGLDFVATISKYGYDSISMYDGADNISVFSPSQIKSADPVTYDDNGDVIPLSQRFNTSDPDIRYSITPQFEQWYKETYGTDLTSSQMKRRLQTAERRAAEAEHDKKAAELKNTIDSEMDLTAWMIHHTKKMREQKRASDAKLADARKAKTEAVRTAVAETKEIERAKAEVQHDADRMAERRNAAKRLRTQENAYTNKVTEMKENAKLKRNAAKATLRDSRLAAKKRAAIETEQGLVDTIRKNPKQRTGVEKLQDAAQQLRTLGRSAYRNFVNMAESIDRFSKRQVSDMRAGTLVNILGGSASTMEAVFKKGLVDRAGNRIGESMSDVFLCWDDAHKKVNEGQQALLQDFMLHWHNIDRMSIVARAESALETFELNNEWLRDMDQKEFARLVAMTEKEVEKLGKYEAQQQAFEYVRLIRAYNEAQNKPIFADDKGNSVTAETSQRIVDQYLEEHPWLLEKANGIYEWWDLFMREWAVGDTISEAEYERMHTMYPHYVPTYRADKNGVGGANFVGAGGANVSKAVKKAKGSHSEVMNIEDSFSNIVSKIIRLNRLNELYMNIIDTAMLDEDGTFADMAYFDWDWQDGAYANALITGSADIADLTDTVEETEKAGLEKVGGDYKLTGWLNGRKYTAYISEDLYKSIGNVTGHLANDLEQNLLKAGNTLTTPMKTAITGINPTFAIRNLSRDLPTAIINSISGLKFPKYYAQAAKEIAKNSEHWQQFQALGGTHATYYNDNKGFTKDMTSRNIGKRAMSVMGAFNEITEAQTRFAEYLATVDRLGDTYENRLQGIKNAAEVTVDFSRKGRYGKVINAWVPYWNPAVQGIDKTIRSVIDSPDGSAIWKQASKTLGRAAMTTILFEAVLYGVLEALDRDDEWEELNDRTKDTYYCIPLKDSKTFLKIPKNREWGAILGTPFMRMLEWANGREDPFENYIETSLEPNFLPPAIFRPDAGGGFATDIIGLSQAMDLAKNEDFAGRTIVPYSYQQGTLSQQYDSETSWFAKKLGQLFNRSPMQIDYIIGDYFGDFGDMFIQATSEARKQGEQDLGKAALDIVTSPFVADARYSNYAVSKYYDLTTELGKVVQDKKNQLGTDAAKNTIEYQTDKAIDEMFGKQITELNRYVRDLPDGDEKDAVKEQIAQLAKDAIEFYEDSMAGKVSNPIRTAEYHDFSETVSKELIRMDAFSGDYKFVPYDVPKSKYNDPDDEKNREYILTDEQKAYFKQLYREKYNEIFEDLIQSSKYKKKKDSEKAELLEDARDDVLDAAKEEFFEWLDDTGVRSTKKKK